MKQTVTFNHLYQENYNRSFLFVKSYIHDTAAVEDIVAESFIKLWKALKDETVLNPYAILITILRNESLNYLKHLAVRKRAMEEVSDKMIREVDYRINTLQACDPEEILSTEITEIIKQALLSLPEQTRLVFEMSRYECKPVKEIAGELHMSPKAVEYHITKALKTLRTELKDYLPLWFLLFFLN